MNRRPNGPPGWYPRCRADLRRARKARDAGDWAGFTVWLCNAVESRDRARASRGPVVPNAPDWEHRCNVLALRAIEAHARWLDVLDLLELRGILTTGEVAPEAVARCHEAMLKLGVP